MGAIPNLSQNNFTFPNATIFIDITSNMIVNKNDVINVA